MPNGYQNPETIRSIIGKIERREWLLPNIQRRFVWDKERIIKLFDSLMMGYPIGSLMVWRIEKKETINKVGFYEFLQDYQERFREQCNDFKPSSEPVFALIDGQQRVNSIYLALKGSYAEKLPRRKWKRTYDSSIQPKEYLYLNLCEDNSNLEEAECTYKFQFLSDEAYNSLSDKNHWYKLYNIFSFNYYDLSKLDDEEFENELDEKISKLQIEQEYYRRAKRTLKKLYRVVYLDERVLYYLVNNDNLDEVVDIFVRTNSGGVPLAFSDLVMSVTVSVWPEAKEKIDEVVANVIAETGIEISRDFVLKCCLYLFSNDIKFRVSNFNTVLIRKIENNLPSVSERIKSVCNFAKKIGLNDETIRAKYALLPLIYYCYFKNIEIDNITKEPENAKMMGVWLKIALIKGFFGGSPDTVLVPIRNRLSKSSGLFPAKEIVEAFAGNNRNLTLSDDDLYTRVIETNYGTFEARLLLSLVTEINPEFSYEHVDHMYPKSFFNQSSLETLDYLKSNPGLMAFYSDKKNWNTLGNLQLLNTSENTSKNKRHLKEWFDEHPEYKSSSLIPQTESGDYIYDDERFKDFVEKRRKLLVERLKQRISFN